MAGKTLVAVFSASGVTKGVQINRPDEAAIRRMLEKAL